LNHKGYLSKMQDVPLIVLKAGGHFDSSRNQPFLTTPTAIPKMLTWPSLSMMGLWDVRSISPFGLKSPALIVFFIEPCCVKAIGK
jgi:hypothetical protein